MGGRRAPPLAPQSETAVSRVAGRAARSVLSTELEAPEPGYGQEEVFPRTRVW
jgi:hypothetical protein